MRIEIGRNQVPLDTLKYGQAAWLPGETRCLVQRLDAGDLLDISDLRLPVSYLDTGMVRMVEGSTLVEPCPFAKVTV